jgi:hypothetical protein
VFWLSLIDLRARGRPGDGEGGRSAPSRHPSDADRTFDPDLTQPKALFQAACSVRRVLMPVATKILHRKRRRSSRCSTTSCCSATWMPLDGAS